MGDRAVEFFADEGDENLHIECPGQQVVSIDYLVNRCSIDGNIFLHCGGTLAGNENINDHSSIFCLASNYSVTNNIGIGHDGTENTRLSTESTFIECHGQHGSVYANKCYGYNCGAIFGAIRNDLFDVVHNNNQYYYVSYGINYDGANGRNFDLISHSNYVVLRNNKPAAGKYNAGHGHSVYQFSDYGYPITSLIKLKSYNNEFVQVETDPTWDGDNVGENVVFEGGKFTSLYIDDRAHGLKSGIKFNYPSGRNIYIKMFMAECGSNNSFISMSTSLIQIQNADPSFDSDNIHRLEIDITLDSECKFTKSIFFQSPRIPISISSKIKSAHWVGLYGGNEPVSTTEYFVSHDFTDINTSLGLEFGANNLHGRVNVGESVSFIKSRGNTLAWNYRGFQDVYTMPISPRPFGDRRGDTITPRQFAAGQPSLIVCVADGPNSDTVGTWKGAGVISS
ncbi:hypothetical protein [Morganella morganii]|uniref:hypothetical protein n=1 Tax=Morganella morganii TaxID=582 RepID=UPI0034E40014